MKTRLFLSLLVIAVPAITCQSWNVDELADHWNVEQAIIAN